jgi:hypothetical protein
MPDQFFNPGLAGGTGLDAVHGSVTVTSGPKTPDAEAATNSGISTLWMNRELYVAAAVGIAATDTAAITTALNAVIANGTGVVRLRRTNPGVPYSLNAQLPTITKPGVSLLGPGSSACVIQPVAALTGDVMRIKMTPFTITQAGHFGGFTLDGTGNSNGITGLHYGDVVGGELDDLRIFNMFNGGGTGLWFDNTTDFTERTTLTRIHLDANLTGWKLTVNGGGGSFGYTRILDARMNVNAGATGLSVGANATLYNSFINLMCNCGAAGATVLAIAAAGRIDMSDVFITAEAVGGASTLVNVAAGGFLRYFGRIQGDANLAFTNNAPGIANSVLMLASGNATVCIGQGAPSKPNVLNPQAGDLFFRTDTPAVANQRIYICTVGGAAPTWVGIV